MRHNLRMPIQRWRCPVVLRVKSVVTAAAGVAVALVFFPLWLAVPVAVLLGVWGLGMAVFGASVTLDTEAGPAPACGWGWSSSGSGSPT